MANLSVPRVTVWVRRVVRVQESTLSSPTRKKGTGRVSDPRPPGRRIWEVPVPSPSKMIIKDP